MKKKSVRYYNNCGSSTRETDAYCDWCGWCGRENGVYRNYQEISRERTLGWINGVEHTWLCDECHSKLVW